MALQIPLVLKDGKISQLPARDTLAGFGSGDMYAYFQAVLSAYDRLASITYSDFGLRFQRINTVTYSSAIFPNSNIVKTVYYTDVGTMNQRITKIEYVGSVFSPQSLRKVFSYSLSGIHYSLSGFEYELF
jgi:hypothetical protein